MKSILLSIALFVAVSACAQEKQPPSPVKGSLDIKYNTRQNPVGTKDIRDIYTLNINVANSAVFHGTISDTPQIIDGWISKTVIQSRSLKYDVACDVVNPKNPAQTKNIGRMYGNVPIDSDGTYRYDTGSLTVDILPIGNAGGFSSKFTGTALGKPLSRPSNWLDTLQREAINITRSVNGKTMTVVLKKYDKMEFRQHVIGAGPVQIYPSVTVNGEMLYDYDKSCWFFNNVTMQYADNGTVKIDRLSGTIRWVESSQRKTSGEGEYQFDVRFNEPPPSATAVFETKASDESAFFETDTSIPALTGTMKYKDAIQGGVTMASSVAINLEGNNITKQQLMAACKIVIFSCVVPMNAD